MYKLGEYIVKNGNGVCKVDNIMHLDMAEKLFFSEMCFVLDKDKDEIHNLIMEAVMES